MANNPYVNKVQTADGTTIIDLTADTVTADKLMQGYTAHDRSGALITGTATGGGTGAISVVDTTDTHGGTIRTITAVDISDTTAVAEDVAQGKYFYTADGTKTEGTSTGGGGSVNLKMGVIRPDAELVKTWSEDVLVVQDLELTIPSYSTSAKTLRAAGTEAETVTLDVANYDYYTLQRSLTIPIYSVDVSAYTHTDYFITEAYYELLNWHPDGVKNIDGKSCNITASNMTQLRGQQSNLMVYTFGNGGNAYISTSSADIYGCYQANVAPTYTASSALYKARILSVNMKGHSSYFPSTAWDCLRDIRIQRITQLYKVPHNNNNLKGWVENSQYKSILNDIYNNNGTLT